MQVMVFKSVSMQNLAKFTSSSGRNGFIERVFWKSIVVLPSSHQRSPCDHPMANHRQLHLRLVKSHHRQASLALDCVSCPQSHRQMRKKTRIDSFLMKLLEVRILSRQNSRCNDEDSNVSSGVECELFQIPRRISDAQRSSAGCLGLLITCYYFVTSKSQCRLSFKHCEDCIRVRC
jgi:hypothetical protein